MSHTTLQLTFFFLGIIASTLFFLSTIFYGWLIRKAGMKVEKVNFMTSIGKPLWKFQKEDITFELGYLPLSSYLKPQNADEKVDETILFTRKAVIIQIALFVMSGLYLHFNTIDFFAGCTSVKKMAQFAVESIDYDTFKSFFVLHTASKLTYFFFLLNSFSALMMLYALFQFVFYKNNIVVAIVGLLYTFAILYFFYKLETHISFVQIGVLWMTCLFFSTVYFLLSTTLISNK